MTARRRKHATGFTGGLGRLLLLGLVPALVLFLVFFYDPEATYVVTEGPPVATTVVRLPELDSAILDQVEDTTREQRLLVEAEPLAHLLERSIDVVPSIATALGMPEQPVAIERLRARPETHRGRYLWYSGQLRHLSRGKSGHPRDGYKIHEGWFETESGEDVLFRVSLPPRNIEVGDHVRVQGFFMKLHDSHELPKTTAAPILVGPELILDFPRWDNVDQLDPAILATIDDELPPPSVADPEAPRGPVWDKIPSSQQLPLWHLTSYARTKGATMDFEAWRNLPALTSKDQLVACRDGTLERGTPIRILGSFVFGHTWEARPNPVGIEAWSNAWVQVKDLGGKLIPVWVPDRIHNQRGDSLEVRGFYFRRFMYDTDRGGTFAPIFVAERLNPFASAPEHSTTTALKWSFVALVGSIIALLFFLARRDRRQHVEHLHAMDERRRRRAARAETAAATE